MTVSFSSLLKSKAYTDLCLITNGNRVLIHRAIVAERCQYFAEIFKKDPSQKIVEVNLPDNCTECLSHVLDFLYSDPNFHVTKLTFGPIIKLAIFFKISALIETLYQWMIANITAENTMYFYFAVRDIQDQLQKNFMDVIIQNIVYHFELIDRGDIWSLPYEIFYKVITHPNFSSSAQCLGSAIAYSFTNNRGLQPSERQNLLELYIKNDWPASLTEMILNASPNEQSQLLPFAAKHFRRLPITELARFPLTFSVQLFSRPDLNAPSSDYVRQHVQSITGSMTKVNKQRNLKIWESFLGDGGERTYNTLPVTKENVRVLILSSVYLDVLTDIREDLIEGGIQPQNIFIFNADTGHPTNTLLFQFDVVFAFTHYQFENPEVTCAFLFDYIQNGGSLVTCYGFCRDDEWGCGDEALDSLMPFTRGTQLSKCPSEKVIVEKNHPLMEGIKTIKHGEFSPRCNVKLNEDSTLVASFADGVPLVAVKETNKQNRKIVAINFYPVSSRVHRLGFNPDQPWTKIFVRSVLYSCGIDLEEPKPATEQEDHSE